MIRTSLFFLLLFLFPVPSTLAGEPSPSPRSAELKKTDLFRAGEGGYYMYRIPGIVVTDRGAILVYCEARAGHGDWTKQDVLMRRSTDGGQTWSPPRKMAERPADLKPNPAAVAQGLDKDNEMTAHNAVAIVDSEPDVIHFLYHVEYARVFYRRSDDDGATWSEPREITSVIDGFRDRYDWKVVGNGCGHAIQLRKGPHRGRLVVAILFSNPDSLLVRGKPGKPGGNRDRRNLTLRRSRDGGRSWPVVRVIEAGPSGYSDLAVGSDGTVYCFYERGALNGDHYYTGALTLVRIPKP